MTTKTRINPATGKAETYEDHRSEEWAKAQVARTRRELRDMLAGNTQFHQEERGDPAAPAPKNEGISMNDRIAAANKSTVVPRG